MKDNLEIIKDFLYSRTGYMKKGVSKLRKILKQKGCNLEGISDEQLKSIQREFRNGRKEVRIPKNLKLKSMWQNAGGEFLRSYKASTEVTEDTYKEIKDELIKEMNKYSPNYEKFNREAEETEEEECLLVIDPADIHLGKLAVAFETGEEYNKQIAVKRVLEGVKGIIDKSKGFNIDKILFIGGNDILHIDKPNRTTTAGTPQDTDGMWYENFLIAKALYVNILEYLITIADVHFVFNPSNHDYMSGFFLADVIKSWFNNNKNITFDTSMAHRKYIQYGNNLIATTHGDGARIQDLPLLAAVESPEIWAKTKHRYVYTHHVHHKTSKDFAGITIESLRSPSGADSWHHRNGYQHSPKAIEGFIHSKENGQLARITHLF